MSYSEYQLLHFLQRCQLLVLAATLTFGSCQDDEHPSTSDNAVADGIGFGLHVTEQTELLYEYGQTRATTGEPALDSATIAANTFGSHALNAEGLYIHRMVLPLVGIHPKSVHAAATDETRASVDDIVSDAISFHDSLTIWGYAYNASSPYTPEKPYTRTLFDQSLLKKIRGWRSSVHWPYDDGKAATMQFYAVAPSFEAMDLTLANTPSYTTAPHIKYTVPSAVAEQRDLLYGSSAVIDVPAGPSGVGRYPGSTPRERHLGDDDKTVELTFSHILTAVRFAQGNMPTNITVKHIQLQSIKNSGTYNKQWDLTGATTANYDIDVNHDVTTYGSNVYIDGGQVMFLMPQTLTSTQKLIVTIQKDGESSTRTISCDLNGDIWLPGYTVTYKITIGQLKDNYYLLVEPGSYKLLGSITSAPEHNATTPTDQYTQGGKVFEHSESGDGSFTIHSFLNYKDYSTEETGTNIHKVYVPWKITGFYTHADASTTLTDGSALTYTDTKPEWINLTHWNTSTSSGVEVTPSSAIDASPTANDGSTLSYTIAAQAAVKQIEHDVIMQNNTFTVVDDQTASTQYLDLSQRIPNGNGFDPMEKSFSKNDPINTANCYIVNGAGNYKIPLVYGNAIQSRSEVINNPSGICVDHLGRTISKANIYKQINYDIINSTTAYADLNSTEQGTVGTGGYKQNITEIRYGGGGHSGDITAELIWQDANSLISSISIIEQPSDIAYGYIGFTISAGAPGNALIAVKGIKRTRVINRLFDKDGTQKGDDVVVTAESSSSTAEILWTWHIWATDEVLPNNNTVVDDTYYPSYNSDTNSKIVQLKNSSGTETAKILPVNLGWVPDDMTWNVYKPREVWVRIEQTQPTTGEKQKAYLKIRQEARPELITGTSTVYQWGRPTALPMVNDINETDRKIYSSSAEITTIDETFKVYRKTNASETFLQYPTYMLESKAAKERWWEDASAPSYWSSTKTLYDPCPPGYQLPTGDIFLGMSLTGANITLASDGERINVWDVNSGKKQQGAWVYAKGHDATIPDADRYGPIVYFPASGQYSGANEYPMRASATNHAFKDKTICYLWTNGIATYESAYQVIFVPEKQTSTSNPFVYNSSINPCYALPIRPVAIAP